MLDFRPVISETVYDIVQPDGEPIIRSIPTEPTDGDIGRLVGRFTIREGDICPEAVGDVGDNLILNGLELDKKYIVSCFLSNIYITYTGGTEYRVDAIYGKPFQVDTEYLVINPAY